MKIWIRQYRRGDQPALELFKCLLATGGPLIALGGLPSQLVERFSNFGVTFNESAVVVSQAQELSEFVNISLDRVRRDCFRLRGVWFHTISCNNMTQVLDLLPSEMAFTWF